VEAGGPAWGAARFQDAQGGEWRKLSVRDLLGDNDFMNIGV
jgi:twitching motility protein PilI